MSANHREPWVWRLDPPLGDRSRDWYESNRAALHNQLRDRDHQIAVLRYQLAELEQENARLREERGAALKLLAAKL